MTQSSPSTANKGLKNAQTLLLVSAFFDWFAAAHFLGHPSFGLAQFLGALPPYLLFKIPYLLQLMV